MRSVLNAYGRALRSQVHGKMLLLSVVPFLLSVLLWGALLFVARQPLIDMVQDFFVNHGVFSLSSPWLAWLGLGVLKTIVVPLIAMLLLLPLMVITALLFIGIVAMPAVVRHVAQRQFATLEKKQGGSLRGSIGCALVASLVFALVWFITLPLYAFPPLALAGQIILWGWLTYRVMAYDALAEHASVEERSAILREHRMPLLAIGMVSGLAGALPGIVWVGGAVLSVVLFPLLAVVSIWLYVMIFIFTGLWFTTYCLQALSDARGAAGEQTARAVRP